MANETNKSSLDSILRAILSIARQSQSMFYSPQIYSEQRNIVESLLLSALVKSYPLNPSVIDQIAPFVEVATIKNTDGFIQLPDNYRNILGSPVVFATPNSTGECNSTEPLTKENFKLGILQGGCRLNPLTIVPQSEFAVRTQSTYDQPTWEAPIGYFFGNKIKVCPYNITRLGVMFVHKESEVRYGYTVQPDDTYLYDAGTTVETEFNSAAYEPIFNAMCSLYFAYAKDPAMQNWAMILSKSGIL